MGDFNKEYASKGVAGAGLGTGIAGLSLGVLNSAGCLLGGMFGRNGVWANGCGCNNGWNGGACGNGVAFDMSVNEALAQRDAEIARLQAKAYSDESDLAIYKYFDAQFKELRQEFCDQKVFNATVNGALGTVSGQLADLQRIVAGITRTAIPSDAVCDFTQHGDSCGRGCSRTTV